MTLVVTLLMWIAVVTTTCLIACMADGMLTLRGTLLSLLAGTVAAAPTAWFTHRALKGAFSAEDNTITLFDKVMIYLFGLFVAQQFLWLYYPKGGQMFALNVNNIGDLPLHLTLTQHFYAGGHFWPLNPVYSYQDLHYPFGMDLFTAALMKLGLPVPMALSWIGLTCGLMTLYALFRWGKGFVLGAFLFSGGLAGIGVFFSGYMEQFLVMEAWKNLALTLLVPQRGFLFAFPAGLILLWSWRQRFLRNRPGLPQPVEGILWGLMPLFHIHTFLFVSFVFVFWAAAQHRLKTDWPVMAWAVIPATIEVLLLTGFLEAASVIWIKPGWMLHDHNPILFFGMNFGLFIPLVIWAAVVVSKSPHRENRLMLTTALYTFGVLMFVMFAPWEWDNTKLLAWSFLMALPILYDAVLKPLTLPVRTAWYVGLFFAGAIILMDAAASPGIMLAEREEVDAVCQAVEPLPITERFAVYQIFNHPVALCGRLLVAGHPAHIWTHGYRNQWFHEKHLKNLMMGKPGWEEDAKALKVRYLYWGYREAHAYPNSSRPWEKTKKRLSATRWATLYDLNTPAQTPLAP